MKRIHYASDNKLEPVNVSQQKNQTVKNFSLKPHGLWYSINDEWEQWCRDQEFRLNELKNKFELILHEDKIITLTMSQLYAFIKKYKVKVDDSVPQCLANKMINWGKVSETYSGIEIIGFDHSATLMVPELDAFYGWDVSSGCIWNTDAIKEIRQIKDINAELIPDMHTPT